MNVDPYRDIIEFGKYKGMIFDEIAEKDPTYILWVSENVNTVQLPKRYIEAIERDIREEESQYLDAWESWMSHYD